MLDYIWSVGDNERGAADIKDRSRNVLPRQQAAFFCLHRTITKTTKLEGFMDSITFKASMSRRVNNIEFWDER